MSNFFLRYVCDFLIGFICGRVVALAIERNHRDDDAPGEEQRHCRQNVKRREH
jgi:hypothetical protein